MTTLAQALFPIPPFPGAQSVAIARAAPEARAVDPAKAADFADAVRTARVGGESWSERDPWIRFGAAAPLPLHADDPMVLLAAMARQAVTCTGEGRFAAMGGLDPQSDTYRDARNALIAAHLLSPIEWLDPFTGAPADPLAVVAQLGAWRRLIEDNRAIAAAYGFAAWKQDTVAALLWPGDRPTPFQRAAAGHLHALPPEAIVAVWKARVPDRFLAALEGSGRTILEVEDGFIRSVGLGADCVPPLSIAVDDCGAHYDPSRPSRLEQIIAADDASPDDLDRARRLRAVIADSGISKYGAGKAVLDRPGGTRPHVLVVGQVEDDRSVRLGGCGLASNLALLERARWRCPDAFLIYRPHPDVVAGHRKGDIPRELALAVADLIDPGNPISALIAMVDEVHVLTSLAGFEALLHGKAVVTHGVPFYAGWGLTTDLGPVPARRERRVSVDALVAAVLIRYPRYLDPVTGLPCSAEILIARIGAGIQRKKPALVALRRGMGWLNRRLPRVRKNR